MFFPSTEHIRDMRDQADQGELCESIDHLWRIGWHQIAWPQRGMHQLWRCRSWHPVAHAQSYAVAIVSYFAQTAVYPQCGISLDHISDSPLFTSFYDTNTHIHRSRIHYTKNNQSMWCEIEFQTQLCRNKVCSAPNTPNYKVLQSLYVFHLALLHVILLLCRGNRSSLFCSPELCRLPMPNSLAIPSLKLVTSGAIASETGRFVIRPFMTIIKFMTLMTLYV